jgi:hypothetical protein
VTFFSMPKLARLDAQRWRLQHAGPEWNPPDMLLELGWSWLKAASDEIYEEQVAVFLTGLEPSGAEENQVGFYGKHDNLFKSVLGGGNGKIVIGDDLRSSTEVIGERSARRS